MAAVASAVALSLALLVIVAPSGPRLAAADSETAQLITYFNQYRAQFGVGALATSSTLNANAQQGANDTAASCSYIFPPGSGLKFATTAYPTAAMVWEAWQNDPGYLPWIRDSKYHTVGVGRSASDCSFGHIWWVILSTDGTAGTPQPTSPPTAPASPTLPATPTPTQSAGTTPTATAATPTTPNTSPPSDSPSPAETSSPSPSAIPDVGGDVDCSGGVDLIDGIEVLKVIGGADAHAPCITASGPDCTGFLNANDALVLFLYLGGLPVELPDGCPPIGSVATPTPGPSPSVTPTPTPAVTGQPGAAMDHCWMAPVVYDMTYNWVLNGDFTCTPSNGASYTCNFPGGSNAIECATGSGLAHYSCYVWGEPGIDVPCASSLTTDGDYLCHQGETAITCAAPAAPTYVCIVADQLITCTGPGTFAWSPTTPVP
jgi:hypothetical protein